MTLVPGDRNFTAYRMRDGDTTYILNFLFLSVGPDRAFEVGGGGHYPNLWTRLAHRIFEPHLVEVVKYNVSSVQGQFVADNITMFHCTLPQEVAGENRLDDDMGVCVGMGVGLGGLEINNNNNTPHYDIVPFSGWQNNGHGLVFESPIQTLALETRWLVACKLCDKWYQINVYR